MALLFMDGFDAGDVSLKWDSPFDSATTTTRFSTGRAALNTGSIAIKRFTPSAKIIVGFEYRMLALGSSGFREFFRLGGDNASTWHVNLRNAGTDLTLNAGGADRGTAIGALPVGSHYIEVSATIADSGGIVSVHVDGVEVLTFTGDTKNGGTSTLVDAIMFLLPYTGGGGQMRIDDLYICDGLGAIHNDFLGDVRVQTLVPNGAGSSTQMTPSAGANYSTVDELPYSASDYVTGSIGQRDLYTTSDLPTTPGTIFGVQANSISKKTDAGGISGRTVLKVGSTTTTSTAKALSASDVIISSLYEQNPDTSAIWTESDVNSIEIGTEATS